MNPIIDALPGVQAVIEERAQVEADWQHWLAWKTEQIANHEQAEADYRAALRRAVENGEGPPPAPEPLALQDEHNRRLVHRQAQTQHLDRVMFREIAAAAPAVYSAARTQVGSGIERARPLLTELEAILKEVRQGQDAVREVLVAQDLVRGVRSVARQGPEPADLDVLADAVRHGRDLLHVRQDGGVLVDRGEDDGNRKPRPTGKRQTGMVVSNARPPADTVDFVPRDGRWQATR